MTHYEPALDSRYSWVMLIVSLLSCIILYFAFFSIPPMITQIETTFGVGDATAGLLMSIVVIPGVVLAIPAGLILNKYGFRIIGVISLSVIAIGSLVTAVSTTFLWLLIGRLITGFSSSFLTIGTVTSITGWFEKNRIGTAIGFFATVGPIGTIIALLTVPTLTQNFGWQFPFYLTTLIVIAFCVIFMIVIKDRRVKTDPEVSRISDAKQFLVNREFWKVSLMWFSYNLATAGFIVWAPKLFLTFKGLTAIDASAVSSVFTIAILFFTPLYGYFSDKTGRRKPFVIAGLLLMAATAPALIFISANILTAGVLVFGVCAAAVQSSAMVLMVNSVHSKHTGVGFGVMSTCYRSANIVAAPLIGFLLEASDSMTIPILAISSVAVIGALLVSASVFK